MSHDNKAAKLHLVGGIRIGTSPPGDYSFYGNLFSRMTREVRNTGALTRYVAFDYLTKEETPITFLGIEVDTVQNIPDGMISWELDSDCLSVKEFNNGEHVTIWEEDVTWQWRDDSPSPCDRGVTGEFTVKVPGEWSGSDVSECRQFSMTANAYTAPGRSGSDDSVKLVDYDPAWSEQFGEFAGWLREHLGSDIALDIEHFGSTSIQGMIAKPVIDVLIRVPSYSEAKPRVLPALNSEVWEYWWHGDHMAFVKRDEFLGMRTHHVHMMPEGRELQRFLAFRDYLRLHAKDAALYAELKQQLAMANPADRERYTDAKSSFVNGIVEKATKTPDNAIQSDTRTSRR